MSLTLTLTVRTDLPLDRDRRHVFNELGGSIGRSQDNDFVLPDPNHYLSRKHALVSFESGAYYLTDMSENGVFLNDSNQPVGKNNTVRLNDGDYLTLGEYRLDVSTGQPEAVAVPEIDALAPEPFPQPESRPAASPWATPENQDAAPAILDGSMQPAEVPGYSAQSEHQVHREPLVPSASEADHSPAEQDFFVPPSVQQPVPQEEAPLDWDKTGFAPAAGSESRKPDWDKTGFVSAAPDEPPLEDWDKTDFVAPVRPEDRGRDTRERQAQVPEQAAAPAQPQTAARPEPVAADIRQPQAEPIAPDQRQAQVEPPAADIRQQPAEPMVAAPPPTAAEVPPAVAASQPRGPEPATAGADVLQSFLQGAGLKLERLAPEAADALMRQQGRLYREIVQGMMEVLRARFELKNEFRMRQTQIQIRENNPLKFIGQVDDALEYLVSKHSSGFLDPESAFKEAFQDIKDHQMAMVVGMRTAFDALLKRFDPEQLERRFVKGGKLDTLVPMYKNANCWERYQEWYADISAAAEDDFQGLFGNEFTRAYEDQMARLALLRRKQQN